ncbi:family 10 glycosylhydrolase [Microcoleus sp. FACHB-672]|uniref:family 10 glycosylhydrolase n=1 Tax=Microcoleus sp. FACHB-672 TaxID=2692825 RepID=UPI002814C4B1|nr:family 10 glycosylhydrolase [Microcoleus sp. FACHB-672]
MLNQSVGTESSQRSFPFVLHAGMSNCLIKFYRPLLALRLWRSGYRALVTAMVTGGLVYPQLPIKPALAEATAYCQLSVEEVSETDNLRQAAFKGGQDAQKRYKERLAEYADRLRQCRSRTWPQNQAIWLRLYPCDIQEGVLEAVLDRIVARGYNQVYVEAFYDGQVLLPEAENKSPWPSAVRIPGSEKVDLLAEAIKKGHERGLKVYAWMFSMNFGYVYSQRSDRQQTLARRANGQTSISESSKDTETDIKAAEGDVSKVFIDPYHPQVRRDYMLVLNAILQRKPDGVLFDYIRYPRSTGAASVVSKVQDLWIYGEAAQQTLYQRALNQKGRELIRRYVTKGFISGGDVDEINALYPKESEPMWQGRNPNSSKALQSVAQLQSELWYLSVAHAVQGVVDFLTLAGQPVQRQGIPAGAVFFPGANKAVGQGGFDSRLQAWDRFPGSMEWHPMAYANCGDKNANCIIEEIQRVLNMAPKGTQVIPALAGTWGASIKSRPSLEAQMLAIRRAFPQINGVSHFAYSWQEPEADRDRKYCQQQ